MTGARDVPWSSEEILRALDAGDLDGVETAFDVLWYELPDRFARELLTALARVPPEVLDRRPRLAHLVLLAQRRRDHQRDDERSMSRLLRHYSRAGLRHSRRLNGFTRLHDVLSAGTAAVVGLRHRRDHDASTRIGTWVEQRTTLLMAGGPLPWTAGRPDARPGWLSAQRGITAMLSGATDPAIQHLRRAADEAGDEPHGHFARVSAASNLALLSAYRGHHDLAREQLAVVRDAAPFPSWIAAAHVHGEALARAHLAIHEGDAATAQRILRATDPTSPAVGELWAFLASARASHAAFYGDPLHGLRELDQVRLVHGMVDPDPGSFVGRLLLRAEAKLLLRAGGAGRVLHLAHGSEDDTTEWLANHHAWAHLSVGEHYEAIGVASSAIHQTSLSPADALDLHVVLAVAHLRAGREDRARSWFQKALRLRSSPEHAAPFLALEPEERRTLAELVDTADVLPRGAVEARNTPPVTLASRLSPRERKVLRSLSEGYTAEQTAARFNVSVNTIRTQIRTLYRKLGVSSRREAVAVAQEAGILAAARGEAVGRSERRYAPGRRPATGTATSITGPGPPASQVGR